MRRMTLFRRSVHTALGFALGALAAAFADAAAAKPARIVSLNICTDQLLLLLVEPERIASLSFFARDPAYSALAARAHGLRTNQGSIEEILPLAPDLVLAGTFTTRATVGLLRRLGYRVVEVPPETSLAAARANIDRVADAIGEPARGAALIAELDRGLADVAAAARRPLAAFYWANGFTSGAGTLADAVAEAAGLENLAAVRGVRGIAHFPLELLLAAAPDLVILGRRHDGAAIANETFRHPALRHFLETRTWASVPDRLWVCGTPLVAEAAARMAAAARDAALRKRP
jgi:iron complex transport system substrate-binding protein